MIKFTFFKFISNIFKLWGVKGVFIFITIYDNKNILIKKVKKKRKK